MRSRSLLLHEQIFQVLTLGTLGPTFMAFIAMSVLHDLNFDGSITSSFWIPCLYIKQMGESCVLLIVSTMQCRIFLWEKFLERETSLSVHILRDLKDDIAWAHMHRYGGLSMYNVVRIDYFAHTPVIWALK
jgi:hypothetical protein